MIKHESAHDYVVDAEAFIDHVHDRDVHCGDILQGCKHNVARVQQYVP